MESDLTLCLVERLIKDALNKGHLCIKADTPT